MLHQGCINVMQELQNDRVTGEFLCITKSGRNGLKPLQEYYIFWLTAPMFFWFSINLKGYWKGTPITFQWLPSYVRFIQSGIKYSTSATLKVESDRLTQIAKWHYVILNLFDLSRDVNTTHKNTFISLNRCKLGVDWSVLSWFLV